jgi:energy-converting hydrogenase Eha subunit B
MLGLHGSSCLVYTTHLGNTIKYLRGDAGIGLSTTANYLRCSTSGVAGNCLCTTIKYLRGAAGVGLVATIKYLRRTTSAAAGNGLSTIIKYFVNQNAGAGNKQQLGKGPQQKG